MNATAVATVVSKHVANNVLHWFKSDEGYKPSYSMGLLYNLAAELDGEFLDRLAEGFPNEVAAFRLGRADGGLDVLRAAAKGVAS